MTNAEIFEAEIQQEIRKKRIRYVTFGIIVVIIVVVLGLLTYQKTQHKKKASYLKPQRDTASLYLS